MIKALLKKQMLGFAAFFFQGKDGKRRSKGAIIGFAVLMAYAFGAMCWLFYMMGDMLCLPLVGQGLSWLYFAFMGAIAMAFGIVGSIFTAKTQLYEAKDNDLLLSMPIPSWLILFSRMLGLYLFTLMFEALIFVPTVVCYFVNIGFSVTTLITSLVCLLVMPLGTLAVCCLLGWLLALIAAKLPFKDLFTVLFSVAFFVGYMIVYTKMTDYLTLVVVNGGVIAAAMKKWLFPFWKLGQACVGNGLSLLLYVLLFIGAFALIYFLLDRTYLRLVTANKGGKKAKYTGKQQKENSALGALLKKELSRFTKNPMVAMNCLLGTIFLLVLPIASLFAGELREVIISSGLDEIVVLVLAIAICFVSSMNMLSAASVSLEGESLWLVRSMPVKTEQILLAKGGLHFLITAIPAAFACIFFCILLQVEVGACIVVLLASTAFIAFNAAFGLLINLKMPNLHWTNELVAVKQSMSAVVAMFSEWGVALLLLGGYFLFGKYLPAWGYLLCCFFLLFGGVAALVKWLQTRGKDIFESL